MYDWQYEAKLLYLLVCILIGSAANTGAGDGDDGAQTSRARRLGGHEGGEIAGNAAQSAELAGHC